MTSIEDQTEKNDNSRRELLKRYKPLFLRVAKWVIAVLVLGGLWIASRSAVTQWREEKAKVQQQIAAIDSELDSATQAESEALLVRREALVASLPNWSSIRWHYVLAAALLYGLGLVPSGFLLRRALVSLGQRPRAGTVLAAQLMGHIGKYVPGKAMVIVIRAGVLARDGVKPVQATMSVFLETFLMMAVGGAVAGIVVLWLPVPIWISVMAGGIALVASLPTFPLVLKVVAKRLIKDFSEVADARIGWGLFVAGWAWSSLSWLLIGASFTVLVAAIPGFSVMGADVAPGAVELYLVCTAAMSLAVVIGFASLLPGGAGIRELVVTTVLAVSIGATHAILAAIAARLLFAAVEGVVALCCWLWLRSSLPAAKDELGEHALQS
ncbi:MAG: lysylphosphatidylglycerol synthase transmembrane domain-containing protein [Rubripirellula sp.]